MSLRPIDMTITLQRTTEINRTQSGEPVRPEVAQQQFTDRMNKTVQQQDQQVNQSGKPEDGKVDQDGRGNSGGGGANKRRRQKQEQEDKPKHTSSSMFDVSI